MITAWKIWLIVAMVAFIVEIFTNTFVFLCFSVGCLASMVASFFTDNINLQLIVFAIFTVISFFTIRPLMNKYAFKKSNQVKTNADALTGSEGYVTETIDNQLNTGRAMVNGDDWRAISENDEIITEKTKIQVVKVDSNRIIVKPLK